MPKISRFKEVPKFENLNVKYKDKDYEGKYTGCSVCGYKIGVFKDNTVDYKGSLELEPNDAAYIVSEMLQFAISCLADPDNKDFKGTVQGNTTLQ